MPRFHRAPRTDREPWDVIATDGCGFCYETTLASLKTGARYCPSCNAVWWTPPDEYPIVVDYTKGADDGR